MSEKKKYKIELSHKKVIGDMLTPVSIYMQIRDEYSNAFLLESSDYHGDEHTFSYICFDPIGEIKMVNDEISFLYPDNNQTKHTITKEQNTALLIKEYIDAYEIEDNELDFISNGLFGYMTYDAIECFEDIQLNKPKPNIPSMHYFVFRYIIAINHFNNELHIVKMSVNREEGDEEGSIDKIESLIKRNTFATYSFERVGEKQVNCTNEEYLNMVKKGIYHCYRGDVFQIVLSRRFSQKFNGDDFNVYRTLRSINPSPYLFYFDFGGHKIFGSSPEAQLIIKEGKAVIHPIAGTFRRTGNDTEDAALAKKLIADPKENAEHIMLVDLARNDLSRHGNNVTVEVYREVQYYSHVIHLVSKVSGQINNEAEKIEIIGDTFPAGTLTGAPKYRAMELIDDYEKTPRSIYGGCIGHLSFNGDFNHAIMIRTFLSKNNELTFQAGAGIVADSKPESELQEVENKLMALNKAIILAEEI